MFPWFQLSKEQQRRVKDSGWGETTVTAKNLLPNSTTKIIRWELLHSAWNKHLILNITILYSVHINTYRNHLKPLIINISAVRQCFRVVFKLYILSTHLPCVLRCTDEIFLAVLCYTFTIYYLNLHLFSFFFVLLFILFIWLSVAINSYVTIQQSHLHKQYQYSWKGLSPMHSISITYGN